jgi:nucleotidyltransferase/DNA polymerase involved in DNA repair
LASYDQGKLVEVFGKNLATYFHCASNGIDEEIIQEKGERESISRIATLKEDTRDLKAILEKTDKLCEEVNSRVQQSGLSYRSIGVVVVTKSLGIRMRTKTLSGPTNDVMIMKRVVKELLQKYLEESGIEVRRVGVHVSNFAKKENGQSQLTGFL